MVYSKLVAYFVCIILDNVVAFIKISDKNKRRFVDIFLIRIITIAVFNVF